MRLKLSIIAIAISLLYSCDKKNEEEYFPDSNAAVVTAADQYIIPSYSYLTESLENLNTAKTTFFGSTTTSDLQNLREALKAARIEWQYCSAIDFGPAVDSELSARMNIFPLDAPAIQTRMMNGETAFMHAQWGFPALAYLIHGDDTEVIANFSGTTAVFYKDYFSAVLSDMTSRCNQTRQAWTNNYRNTFVNATGTAAGSGISLLVNALIQDFEKLKRDKIALPLGLLTLGIALPEKTEAYYAQYSAELATEHCKSIQSLFMGKSRIDGVDLYGLDDLLDEASARYNGQALSEVINQQFELAVEKLTLVPDPLSETIINNPEPVQTAYQELQEIVVFLKTDMPSSLGIAISFSDNDGD